MTISFLSSCRNKTNDAFPLFDSIKINRTEHLLNDKTKPFCNIVINIAYPISASSRIMKDSLTKSILSLCLGENYTSQSPQIEANKYAENYLAQYHKEIEPIFKEETDSSLLQWYTYYRAIIGKIHYRKFNLITYVLKYNEYAGGAHSVYSSTFINIDLKNMKTIKLNDLFAGNYLNDLTSIITQQLIKDSKVKTYDQLLDKGYGTTGNISPTENFYLDSKGITFYYNVYEIAPYSAGPIPVFISYDRLRKILNNTLLNNLGIE